MKFYKLLLLSSITLLTACKQSVTMKDEDGNSIQFEITDIELTSGKIEAQKDELILKSINDLLKNETSSVIQNYWFLCDTSRIKSFRNYSTSHKNENIEISIGKKSATVTPIPMVYKIVDGPFGEYKITDDSLGKFASYLLEVELTEKFLVKNYKATLRFTKEQENGLNKLSFAKEISKNDVYSIEENIKSGNWN